MKGKRKTALLLCMAMVFTLISPGQIQAKAKKPTLSKKKVEITAGKKATIKVKRGKKAAKVSWKTSKKSVAKIVKKTKKGNKARATIKGVRAGKAKITAVYKLGKKKTKLTCKVTVKSKDSGTDKQPTGNTSGKPTGSPSGSPSTAPTQKPSGSPSTNPSTVPSTDPSTVPSVDPSTVPSTDPSTAPSVDPSTAPSVDPSTEPSTDPSASPSATPVDETHDVINISEDNVAFAKTETAEYKDGTAKVGLSSADSGKGICFYLNAEHTSVDMAKYKNLEIEYEAEAAYDMAISLKDAIPAGAATDFWAGNNSKTVGDVSYPTFSKGAATYKLSLSTVKDKAQGIFIKYNTYNKESTADPVATITIKSIKLEKDPSYVAPTATPAPSATPVVASKKITLSQEKLAYSNADSTTFEGGKMNIKSASGVKNIGLYLNDDKSSVDLKDYEAIKIGGVSAKGDEVALSLGLYADDIISDDAANHGGISDIRSGASTKITSGGEGIARWDIMQPHVDNPTTEIKILELSIKGTDLDYTINSIELLKKDPREMLEVGLKEDNLAFQDAESYSFHDGQLDVTLAKGQVIGLYLKDDHSEISSLLEYTFEKCYYGTNGTSAGVGGTVKAAFVANVTGTDAATKGGGDIVFKEFAIVGGNENRLPYYNNSLISSTFLLEGKEDKASVVYFTTSKTKISFTIKGLRFHK